MDTVKHNSQKSSKKIDWKLFFNVRIFRYTFISQLKSIATYVFFGLTIIISVVFLFVSFSWAETHIQKKFADLELDSLKENVKIPISYYKLYLYMLFILTFTLFITFKSLQIFRDEMDDGTLLIFSSMPYTRLKLIIQKWFSLQAVCLIYTLSVIFISPIIFLLFKGFSTPSWEVAKVSYENSQSMIVASLIFQLLISTFAVIISLYISKVGAIGILSIFSAGSVIMFMSPMFVQQSILKKGNSSDMNEGLQELDAKPEQSTLFQYAKDPDLKDLFEIENWYGGKSSIDLDLEFDFDQETIIEFEKILTKYNSDITKFKQIWEDFSKINIKGKISVPANTPKAIRKIFNLFKKVAPNNTINFRSIRVNDFEEYKLNEDDQKLIQSNDIYETALDNNDKFTQKEKKISQLNKTSIEDYKQTNKKDIKFVNLKHDTSVFKESFSKLISSKIPFLYNYMFTNEFDKYAKTKNLIAYFIDNPAFQNLKFFVKNLYEKIVLKMYQFKSTIWDNKKEDIMKINESISKYLKFVRINNYLNVMTQIAFIWNSQIDGTGHSLMHDLLLNNYYGEWEKKEFDYKKEDGTSEKIEVLKLNLESFKRIINPNLLYIIYPLISLSLAGLLIFMIYRKDFV